MAASIPKKKKLIRIIIILSLSVRDDLDEETTDTQKERLLGLIKGVEPQMQINEANWSTEQNNVWAVVEDVNDALDENDPPNEGKAEAMADNLEAALNEL